MVGVLRPRSHVVDRLEQALSLARRGCSVVLVVAENAEAVSLPDTTPGRVAIFVGPPDDPVTWQKAEEMAKELFAP